MKVKLTWFITQAKEIYCMSLVKKDIEVTSTAVWLPYYRKLTLHEIKVFEINAT